MNIGHKILDSIHYLYQAISGGKYYGQRRFGLKHGYGKYTWKGGDVYEGEWINNLMHGQGRYKWNDGAVYEGEWRNGEQEGKGKMIFANGDRYEGGWKDGKAHGYGTHRWKDGAVYEGLWQNDKREGKGKMMLTNGDRYEGEWKNGDIIVNGKDKKQNKHQTIVVRSETMVNENLRVKKYEEHKFLPGGEKIDLVIATKPEDVIKALEALPNINRDDQKTFRLVFNQHGHKNGFNDINIDEESAKRIITILAEKGYKHIIISDLACYGGTAYHFRKFLQETCNKYDIHVTMRSGNGNMMIVYTKNSGIKDVELSPNGFLQRNVEKFEPYNFSNFSPNLTSNLNDDDKNKTVPPKANKNLGRVYPI